MSKQKRQLTLMESFQSQKNKNKSCSTDMEPELTFSEEQVHFLGSDLNEMPTYTNSTNHQGSERIPTVLRASDEHCILFRFEECQVVHQAPPKPYPSDYIDMWDCNHIRMPCSSKSLYPVSQNADGEARLQNRWDMISDALLKPICCADDLEKAIMSYNSQYLNRWSFDGLKQYFRDLSDEESVYFWEGTFPFMVKLALKLPCVITQPIPLLRKGVGRFISMSQEQAASLLANAFFCTFPRRNAAPGCGNGKRTAKEYCTFPDINFSGLFARGVNGEKIKCLLHYFQRLSTSMPVGIITFERKVLKKFPVWSTSSAHFRKLHCSRTGTIEDFGTGMRQMDFANRFVGGGVLRRGCVQEEIRFLICPEMIVSCLFTECLSDNECLVMTGCERFSYYTGYASSFEWAGPCYDTTPTDGWGRKLTEVVAADAIHYRSEREQFSIERVLRELNKAYCAFAGEKASGQFLASVATGNWGCGAFNGDKRLKALIQLMAASEAGRDVAYFTFEDGLLMKDIHRLHRFLVESEKSVGDVYKLVLQFCERVPVKKDSQAATIGDKLFKFLLESVLYDVDTDSDMELIEEEFENSTVLDVRKAVQTEVIDPESGSTVESYVERVEIEQSVKERYSNDVQILEFDSCDFNKVSDLF